MRNNKSKSNNKQTTIQQAIIIFKNTHSKVQPHNTINHKSQVYPTIANSKPNKIKTKQTNNNQSQHQSPVNQSTKQQTKHYKQQP